MPSSICRFNCGACHSKAQLESRQFMTYLVVLIQCIEIACFNQLPDFVVAQANSVVEVSEPYDCIVVLDSSISLETEATANCPIVTVSVFEVGKTSGQVGGYKAYAGVRVLHAYGHRPFVSCHAGHASLSKISSGPPQR